MSEVNDAYSVEDYVADLRRIDREESDDREKCRKLESLSLKLAHTLANQPGGLKEEYFKCDPDQGFGLHLLHEEEDHSLPVFLFSWLPGRGTPVHDHKTWGVVVGISGVETEILCRLAARRADRYLGNGFVLRSERGRMHQIPAVEFVELPSRDAKLPGELIARAV